MLKSVLYIIVDTLLHCGASSNILSNWFQSIAVGNTIMCLYTYYFGNADHIRDPVTTLHLTINCKGFLVLHVSISGRLRLLRL